MEETDVKTTIKEAATATEETSTAPVETKPEIELTTSEIEETMPGSDASKPEIAETATETTEEPTEAGSELEHAEGEEVQSPTDIEALLAEAEQRGYLRGRNEKIEKLMAEPAMYERPRSREAQPVTEKEILILNNLRKSVWD